VWGDLGNSFVKGAAPCIKEILKSLFFHGHEMFYTATHSSELLGLSVEGN
jgi:hypothetical protein